MHKDTRSFLIATCFIAGLAAIAGFIVINRDNSEPVVKVSKQVLDKSTFSLPELIIPDIVIPQPVFTDWEKVEVDENVYVYKSTNIDVKLDLPEKCNIYYGKDNIVYAFPIRYVHAILFANFIFIDRGATIEIIPKEEANEQPEVKKIIL